MSGGNAGGGAGGQNAGGSSGASSGGGKGGASGGASAGAGAGTASGGDASGGNASGDGKQNAANAGGSGAAESSSTGHGSSATGMGQFGATLTQLGFSGADATLTFAGGSGESGAPSAVLVPLFSQAGGESPQPLGMLRIAEQGQTLTATRGKGEASRLGALNLRQARMVTLDYRLPGAAQRMLKLTVGLTPEGVLIVRVSPAMKRALDERHLVLVGTAVAKERLQARVADIRAVLIQVQGR